MGNTSTKSAEEVRKEISRVLEELASYSVIHSITNPKRCLYFLEYCFLGIFSIIDIQKFEYCSKVF